MLKNKITGFWGAASGYLLEFSIEERISEWQESRLVLKYNGGFFF